MKLGLTPRITNMKKRMLCKIGHLSHHLNKVLVSCDGFKHFANFTVVDFIFKF